MGVQTDTVGDAAGMPEFKRAREVLEPVNESCENVLDSSGEAISVINVRDYTIVRANSASLEQLGLKEEEVVGKTCYEVIHHRSGPCTPPESACPIVDTPKGKMLSAAEHVRYPGDDQNVYAKVCASRVRNVGGGIVEVIHVVRDVTEPKRTADALRLSEERFSKAFSLSPAAMGITTLADGYFVEVNESFTKLTGYRREEAIGHTGVELGIWATSRDRTRIVEMLKARGEVRDVEIDLRTKSGEMRIARMSLGRIDLHEEPCILAVVSDITGRKQAEEALRQSEARLVEAQLLARLGNWEWDIGTNEVICSEGVCHILDMPPQSWGRQQLSSLVHPDDRELVRQCVNEALHQAGPFIVDCRIVRPDGSERIVHCEGKGLFDEGESATRMVGVVQDITELKRVETELRALSRRLLDMQEDQRRAIARELHDEIGQSLNLVKLSLDRATRAGRHKAAFLQNASEELHGLIEQVRSLSLRLQPSMLDDLGLLEALTWHFQRYTSQTGVRVDFTNSGLDRKFDRQVSTAVFRIVQEALTNVVRHARANLVKVSIRADQRNISMSIEDRGAGFHPSELAPGSSCGLRGMSERSHLLGGTFAIESAPGTGTRVAVELPLRGP